MESGYCQTWLIPVDHVLHYGIHLKWKGLAVCTISSRLSILAFASKSLGHGEFTSDFRVRRMLEGWCREEGPQQDLRQPLLSAILRGLRATWVLYVPWNLNGCCFM